MMISANTCYIPFVDNRVVVDVVFKVLIYAPYICQGCFIAMASETPLVVRIPPIIPYELWLHFRSGVPWIASAGSQGFVPNSK